MSATTGVQSLDQKRAANAWKLVQDAKAGEKAKEFGIQAKKMPVRILTSGLGQATAFLAAKKYAPNLAQGLSDWINKRIPGGGGELLDRIRTEDSDFLRRATDEAMAYLKWVTRFAEAEGLTDHE